MNQHSKIILKFVMLLIISLLGSDIISADDTIPKRGAKYIFKTWEYDIVDGKYTGKVHQRKIIYNRLGEDYNQVSFYENDFRKVIKARLVVLNANGDTLYTKHKKHFKKQCGHGAFGGYDDDCDFYLYGEASTFPYIIDFAYTVESKNLFSLRGATFQHYIPVDSVSYTINNYDGTVIYSKMYGIESSPIISDYNGATTYQWLLDSIPALKSIKRLPADAREKIRLSIVCEKLSLGGYTIPEISWNGIGQWYNLLYKDKCNALPLQATYSSEDIYNSVIDSIRYVAIEIGVGGWQPYDAALTESRAFGDCKDMSTLLVSRLRDQTIEAYPVLVLTRDNGRIDTEFPIPSFNHVIAVTISGNDTTWMDPTCNSCAYGELPSGDEDIDVLVITEDGGVIRRTPASKPTDNQLLRKTTLTIAQDKSVQISSQFTIYGNYGRNMRDYLTDKTENEKREYLTKYINNRETKFILTDFSFENFEEINKPFIMHIEAIKIKKVDKIGKKWYVNPYMFFREKNITKIITADREYPIKLNYPYKVIDSISIHLDSSLLVDSVQFIQADSIETSYHLFTTKAEQIDNAFYCIVTKELKTYQVNPDQFFEYELFYKKLKKITSKYMKLYTQ